MDNQFRTRFVSGPHPQQHWQSFQETNRNQHDAHSAVLTKQIAPGHIDDTPVLSSPPLQVAPSIMHPEQVSTSRDMQPCDPPVQIPNNLNDYGPPSQQLLSETHGVSFEDEHDQENAFYSSIALPQELMESPIFPPIDFGAAIQIGRLKYAVTRKEQARAWFKESTKRKHLTQGEADKFMRRRRGDLSMNIVQLKKRRLRMNQDSAAASRYARDEYIQTLEAMVQSAEKGMAHVTSENSKLRHENKNLNSLVSKFKDQLQDGSRLDMDNLWEALSSNRRVDAVAFSKLLDLVTNPEQISAQANGFEVDNLGIKAAPAV